MDLIKEDSASSKTDQSTNEEEGIPASIRSDSTDSDEAWMLIEVEKFQETLDQSFLGSSLHHSEVSQENFHSEVEENVQMGESDVVSATSLSGSVSSHLSSSVASHSSIESSSHSVMQTEDTVQDSEKTRYHEEVKGEGSGVCVYGGGGSINASEMFQQFYKEHAPPSPPGQQRTPEQEEEGEEEEEGGGSDRGTEALAVALQQAEQEVAALRTHTLSLMDKQYQQEQEIAQLRQERQEREEREQERLREMEREMEACMEKEKEEGREEVHPPQQLVSALRHLTQRLQHLERETRQVRLLREGQRGGVVQEIEEEEEEEKGCGGVETVPYLMSQLDGRMCELENELIPLVSRLLLPSQNNSSGRSDDLKISLKNFEDNDLALFFPTPKGEYLAFNIGAPHHFLSEESKALIGQDTHFKKLYVLGRIVMKETRQQERRGEHPKGLAKGVQYHSLSVTSVADQLLR